jgi:hypothetical protein
MFSHILQLNLHPTKLLFLEIYVLLNKVKALVIINKAEVF